MKINTAQISDIEFVYPFGIEAQIERATYQGREMTESELKEINDMPYYEFRHKMQESHTY